MSWAPPASGGAAAPPAGGKDPAAEAKLQQYLRDMAKLQEKDSVWTKEKQIERLTKPSSKYLNLNPWEVLQIDPGTDEKKIKKQFRKLSILVHPDKNPTDQERAELAFEAVNTANQTLKDEDKMSYVNEMLEQGEESAKEKLKEKRQEARRMRKTLPEDEDPELHKAFVRKITVLLFADYHKRKEELLQEDSKRKAKFNEELQEARAKKKARNDAEDKWEAGTETRVNSWRDFGKKEKKKKKKEKKKGWMPGSMKMPKLKPQERPN
eukprot:gene9339-29257_t